MKLHICTLILQESSSQGEEGESEVLDEAYYEHLLVRSLRCEDELKQHQLFTTLYFLKQVQMCSLVFLKLVGKQIVYYTKSV